MSAIDRDIVIKKYINPDIEKFHNSDVKIVLENLKQNILKMPSADRPPNPHDITYINALKNRIKELEADRPQGEWIIEQDEHGHTYGRCPVCGMKQYAGYTNFCPDCGARMKGANK